MDFPSDLNTSVVLPCHNVAKTIGLQLECLSRQRGADPFEVVLVDNKSTDDTCAIAQQWEDRLNLRIVVADEHAGVSYARNVGVRESIGEKLIFIDGDDAVPADYVAFGQRSLNEVPVYVAGFNPVEAQEFDLGIDHVLSLIEDKCLEYKSPLPMETDPEWPVLPGCSFGIRKSVFIDLHGFDLIMEPGAEDNDFAIRLIDAGYSLPVQRSTTIAYRIDNSVSRPISMYYRRAKSVARLLTISHRWNYQIRRSEHPAINLAKALVAGLKIIKEPAQFMNWMKRISISFAMAEGYFIYQLMNRVPRRRLGEGTNEDSN